MMHYAQRRSPSSNAVGIGLVALLHLGAAYVLITGLGTQFHRVILPETHAHVFNDPKPLDPVPVPPPPFVLAPPLAPYIPPPVIPMQPTAIPPVIVGSPVVPPDRGLHPIAPPQVPQDTAAGAKRLAGPELVYPVQLLTGGLEGWVDVQCDVDETGRTSGCATIAHQGSNLFVEAALAYVMATRYSPAMHNGVAVTEPHHRFHIEFKLKD